MVEISFLLLRIFVVDEIKIDMRDLLRAIIFGQPGITDIDGVAQITDIH